MTVSFDTWEHIVDKLDQDLFIKVTMQTAHPNEKGERQVTIEYQGMFVGEAKRLLRIMAVNSPESGLSRTDCQEMTRIKSVLFIGGYPDGTFILVLLEAKPPFKIYFKAKSVFVRDPIPETAIQKLR